MKTKPTLIIGFLSTILCFPTFAQGTAFTYQGRLNDGTNPANGIYNLRFAFFDAFTVGNPVGAPLTNAPVNITNGLFAVTLDFGNQYSGANRWLEVGVRTNGPGSFFTLSPRQALTPTPYAVMAGNVTGVVPNAGLSGTYGGAVTFNNPGNSFSGNGSGLTSLNAGNLSSGTVPTAVLGNAWKTTGNGGTSPGANFIGTTDNQPLELRVGGTRALRLEPNVQGPNVIGGAPVNFVANGILGATIAGGGANGNYTNSVLASYATVGGGANNVASGVAATLGGGRLNTASSDAATVSGGDHNSASGTTATVGGGGVNIASGSQATVSGGNGNTASGSQATVSGGNGNSATNTYATVSGGFANTAIGLGSTVPGGAQNTASGTYSVAAGFNAQATNSGAFVWSDDSSGVPFSSTTTNQFSVRALGGVRLVTGGAGLTLDGQVVGTANLLWQVRGNTGTTAGTNFLGTADNQPLELKVNNQRALRLEPNPRGAPNVIAGSSLNSVSNGVVGATIGGGGATNYNGLSATNTVAGDFGTVSGGYNNTASALGATVGGGRNNTASAAPAFVGGGELNTASGLESVAVGGYQNTASGTYSMLGGGFNNSASGFASTVAGGGANIAASDYCFAAGAGAQALHFGSFVWKDDSAGTFASTTPNQFSVFASGGLRFAGDIDISGGAAYHHLQLSGGNALGYLYGSFPTFGDGIHLGYNYYADASGVGHVSNIGGGTSRITTGYGEIILAVGGVNAAPLTTRLDATTAGVTVFGTFNNLSDRNAKQGFSSVSPMQILERVAQLPISEWSYKDDPNTRHLGPVAQDFYSALNIGTDEKHIAPIDEGGVALAAIQGLNLKVQAQQEQLRQRDSELRELKSRLTALEMIIGR